MEESSVQKAIDPLKMQQNLDFSSSVNTQTRAFLEI